MDNRLRYVLLGVLLAATAAVILYIAQTRVEVLVPVISLWWRYFAA
jgi:hypothetical protein